MFYNRVVHDSGHEANEQATGDAEQLHDHVEDAFADVCVKCLGRPHPAKSALADARVEIPEEVHCDNQIDDGKKQPGGHQKDTERAENGAEP